MSCPNAHPHGSFFMTAATPKGPTSSFLCLKPSMAPPCFQEQASAWHVRPCLRWPWLASLSSTSATFLQEPSLLTALPSPPACAMVHTCNSLFSLWILEIPRKAFEKAKGNQCVSKEEGSYHPASIPQAPPQGLPPQREEARCCFSGCPPLAHDDPV